MAHPSAKIPRNIYLINPTSTLVTETVTPTNGKVHTVTCLTGGIIKVTGGDTHVETAAVTDGSVRRSAYEETNHAGKLIDDDALLINNSTLIAVGCDADGGAAGVTSGITVTRNHMDITASVTFPQFEAITTDADGNVSAINPTSVVGAGLELGDIISIPAHSGTISFTIQEDDLQLAAGFYIAISPATTNITMLAGQTIHGNWVSVAATGSSGTDPIFAAYT